MKKHLTEDLELRQYIFEGLKKNKSFCPCVMNSLDKPEYKCPCKDFRENTKAGESCFCGLYIKDEE